MKRLLVSLSVLAVILGATGCGSDEQRSDQQGTTDPPPGGQQVVEDAASCEADPQGEVAKAAFVIMPGYGPDELDAVEALLGEVGRPAGVFINADLTPGSPERLKAIQDSHDVLLAVDEEGGVVQRLEDVYGEFASAAGQASDPSSIYENATNRADQLASAGFNVDFAPVVDLRDPASESVIGTRSYGTDPDLVTAHAGAMAKALRSAGIAPTFKHFPGHGRGAGDSHDGLVTTPPLDELLASDVSPYRILTRASPSLVMMGHLAVPGLTADDEPASLAASAYELLRDDVGFGGVAITDDLAAMKAITDDFSATEAGVRALAAGADIVLYTDATDFDDVVEAVADAISSGGLPEARVDEAIDRIRTLLGCE